MYASSLRCRQFDCQATHTQYMFTNNPFSHPFSDSQQWDKLTYKFYSLKARLGWDEKQMIEKQQNHREFTSNQKRYTDKTKTCNSVNSGTYPITLMSDIKRRDCSRRNNLWPPYIIPSFGCSVICKWPCVRRLWLLGYCFTKLMDKTLHVQHIWII